MKVLIIVSCLSICLGVDCVCLNKEVTSQVDLDRYIDEARSGDDTRCIHWTLIGSTYQLDLIKLLSINLQQNNSLMIKGHNGTVVDIHCVGGASDMDLEAIQPLSHVSSIVLDSLNFMGCPVPILVEEVPKVIISNCIFQNHSHGAVSLYNCTDVTITNCTFYDNKSQGYFSRKPNQGNSGGLTIGYTVLHPLNFDVINILITDCNFTLNRAYLTMDSTSSTEASILTLYPARGGGVIIIPHTSTAVNCTITNNLFTDNDAEHAGGAVYILTQYTGLHHYYFANNVFIRNKSPDGGALLFIPAIVDDSKLSINFTVYNCTFDSNVGIIYAGALVLNFFFSSNDNTQFVTIDNCTFRNNSGADYAGAVDVATIDFFSNRNAEPIRFKNCVFVNNVAPDAAAISIVYYNAIMENVTFINHTGSTLRVISGRVELRGQVNFYSNDAVGLDGGAIYLLSYSELFLQNDTHLEFINNTGSFGAAVVVVTGNINISEGYTRNFYNPMCFLQYNDSSTSPSDINNSKVSVLFSGNSAITGPAIFTSRLDLCSWYSTYPPYFKESSEVLRWPFISYNNNTIIGDNTNATTNTATANAITPVQTSAVNFKLIDDSVMAYPGQMFQLRMVPLDEQNSTAAILVEILQTKSNDKSRIVLSFNPSARILQPNDINFFTNYSVSNAEILARDINEIKDTIVAIKSHRSEYTQHSETFKLIIAPCPPGHKLRSTNANDDYVCLCNDDNDKNIINCQLKEKRIIIKEGLWAQHIDVGTINGILEYYQCPPGYCQCTRVDNGSNVCNSVYYYENDDLQCVCDRKGYLCGQCRGDKGVSVLLNNCVSCGYVNILLIIALVIVDVVVITGILLSTHIKWSSWLYPSLYYLQVTPIAAQYFPVTFSAVQPYLYYISSAVSLYFPYDFCLYPGMTALASYSFRYIPLIVFIIVLSITFSLYRLNVKIFGQCRFSWNGLWFLIVLLFTNVISTSVSILNCPRLHDHDRENKLRWFVDGTVECFTGGHAALAVFAILILAICVILIMLVAVIAMGHLRNLWTVSFRKVLQISFTDQYKWWATIELLIRLVFIMVTLVFHRNLIPVLLCVIIYTAAYAYIQPFNNQWVNILETTVLVDILLMLAISSIANFKQSTLNSNQSFSIDHCGQVDAISEHAAMLIPFYYFPLIILFVIILFVIITRKIIVNIKETVLAYVNRDRSQSFAMDRKHTTVHKKTENLFELVFYEDNQLTVNMVEPVMESIN